MASGHHRNGAPGVIDVRIAATAQERDDAFAVRIAVFVDEQGIPRSEELDELDASAVHCVAYEGGRAIGAGRLVVADGYAKVGRMAVLGEHRRSGVGTLVLAALEREAASRGVPEVRLSAQLTACAFYERNGYHAIGGVYDEVGIPHIAMVKRLAA